MIALSIHLPEKIVQASQLASEELGISRTQFIRQAIIHELENFKLERERQELAKSFHSMNQHQQYLQESQSIDTDFDDKLPKDKDKWWE